MVNDAGEGVSTRVNAMGDDDSGPSPSELVGRSIAGKFVVEALIATGGAGAVYRARQLALDRVVALKVLRQDIARDRYFVERFKREARAASRLDHPNSVRVFDFGHIDESLLYLASRPGSASRRPASCGRSRTTSPRTRIWISRSTSGWSERSEPPPPQWRGR